MLNVKTENAVKKFEDFQEKKINVNQLEIICIFMNQSDIFICMFSILKKKMSSYEQLYFLLNQAVENFVTSVLISAFKNSQAARSLTVFLQNLNDDQAVENFTASILISAFENS